MYTNMLSVAVKSGGKILREVDGVVRIPFGSEYSLVIKNHNVFRAVVKITIDGTEVTNGGLIAGPDNTIDLQRYINDLHVGNKFKFIEMTDKIAEFRGERIDDGLIQIEFQFELPAIQYRHPYDNSPFNSNTALLANFANQSAASTSTPNAGWTDRGITVPGSISKQKFVSARLGTLDGVKSAMVIRLVGQTADGAKITEPVAVQTRLQCPTCGTPNRSNHKFCSECGTGLQIS